MSYIANTPEPPYYTVIFTSLRTEGDNGYAEVAETMASQPSAPASAKARPRTVVLIFQSPNSQGRA
jgi:hypothetical protein